jgi:UDP-N-acetyl-2-amino-2-deoxyglucuronate dehydrogenase
MTKESSLGFAVVGCGRIAQKYSQIFQDGALANAHLVGVCDVKPYRAQNLAEKHGIRAFDDMRAMMTSLGDAVDVVCVLTESGLHAEHVQALAPYGKHLVVEKPMALTLTDADCMIEAADAHGVKLFVVKQNRYNRPVQKLREAIDEGRFGKMVMGTVRVRWCRRQAYYDQDSWRGTWAFDGGVFANQASHHIDLLEWFMGRPVSVFAKSRRALVDVECEDTGVAIVTFESGAIGLVEATTATRPKDLEGSVSLLGERGSVEIGGFAVNEMRVWRFEDSRPDDDNVLAEFRENPPNVYGFGHVAYLRNVIDAIRDGVPSLVDGLEGRKSLELITAIYESIETGREVPLRFKPKYARLGRRPTEVK